MLRWLASRVGGGGGGGGAGGGGGGGVPPPPPPYNSHPPSGLPRLRPTPSQRHHLLTHANFFLAPACPGFFLSDLRASRVKKPAFLSTGRSDMSRPCKAVAIP